MIDKEPKKKYHITVWICGIILAFFLILLAFGRKASDKPADIIFNKNRKYTCSELHHMPYMELYSLFLSEGLQPIDEMFGTDETMDKQAQGFKDNFERSHLGIPGGSHTAYLELANQTKEIFDRIAKEPDVTVTMLEATDDSAEFGYLLKANVDRISLSRMSASVQDVKEQIRKQFKNENTLSSQYPGSMEKEFGTYSDGKEFIGLDSLVDNVPLRDYQEGSTNLNILGNKQGDIQELSIHTDFQKDDIFIQTSAHIYTDHHTDDVSMQFVSTERLEYFPQYFCVKGYQHVLTIGSSIMDSGRCMQDGYLVKDGILYQIHISYPENQLNDILGLVQEWADSLFIQ